MAFGLGIGVSTVRKCNDDGAAHANYLIQAATQSEVVLDKKKVNYFQHTVWVGDYGAST